MLEQDGPPCNDSDFVLADNVALTTAGLLLDVTPFPSVHIDVEFDLPNRSLALEWRRPPPSTVVMNRQLIKSGFRTAVSQGSLWRATVPCRSGSLFLDTNAAGLLVSVVGSFRPCDKIVQDVIDADQVIITSENANYLWSERNNILPTANSLAFDLHPWFGSITADVSFSCTAAMGTSSAQWQRNQNGVAAIIRRDAFTADPVTNTFGVTTTIACHGDALRWQLTNNSGVDFTAINSTITPTGGFGL